MKMSLVTQRLVYIVPVACIVALFWLFQTTDPISIGPAGILLVFILLYVFFASCLFIILHVGLGMIGKVVLRHKTIEHRKWSLGVRKSYYVASILAFAPVCLLAVQSIGQLELRDVALVVALTAIAIFYTLKRQ